MPTASHSLLARPREERPLVLGRYRLGQRLGSGGFGTVYAAHDERLDRAVAVKRIEVGTAEAGARAEREARAAARLAHPGIVALHEAGAEDGAVYLVSELVRGRTLDRLLADGLLSDRDVVALGAQLCDALGHAHKRGVVHRDVKPANVIVPDAEDGSGLGPAKLTDFGIAHLRGDDALTRTGDVVGTLAYMAPEQAEGRPATHAVDLYALGLVLFEALAGVNPVRGRTPAATVRRVGVRLPALGRVRRDLPLELCTAIDRAVAVHPEQRGSLTDLRRALKAARAAVDDEPGTVEGPALEPLTRLGRRGGAAPWTEDLVRAPPGPLAQRAAAAVGAAAMAGGAMAFLGPRTPGASALPAGAPGAMHDAAAAGAGAAHHVLAAPIAPGLGALVAGVVVAALPRAGWLAVALGLLGWVAAAGEPGTALLVALALAPVPLVLASARPGWWSAPTWAVALGALGLGTAFVGAAGQVRRWPARAALGALGAWWLVLAEPVAGRVLLLDAGGGARGPGAAAARAGWEGSTAQAAERVVGPLLGSGALLLAAVWALFAAVLPLLVRGRHVAADVVAATAWAAALAAASQPAAAALRWPDGAHPSVRGLLAGAALAAALAVAARAAGGPR